MAEKLMSDRLRAYLHELAPERPAELIKMEAYADETGFPIIGPVAGHLCYQIARMVGAQRIFELGSGYGYSTAWFARAAQENGGGVVHHTVWSQDLSDRARRHLDALGFGGLVQYQVSESVAALEKTPGPFDLIFNDIEKQGYPESLPVIKERLRAGGVLIVDNVLWSGRVLDESDRSQSTQSIREVTSRIADDPDWIFSIIPIRDGLLVAHKV